MRNIKKTWKITQNLFWWCGSINIRFFFLNWLESDDINSTVIFKPFCCACNIAMGEIPEYCAWILMISFFLIYFEILRWHMWHLFTSNISKWIRKSKIYKKPSIFVKKKVSVETTKHFIYILFWIINIRLAFALVNKSVTSTFYMALWVKLHEENILLILVYQIERQCARCKAIFHDNRITPATFPDIAKEDLTEYYCIWRCQNYPPITTKRFGSSSNTTICILANFY